MPPAAFIGAAIGSFLLGLVQWFGMKMQGGYSEDGWWYLYIMPVITAAAFGWMYARIACYVAPRGKLITGVVMTTLLSAVGLVSITIVWLGPRYRTGEAIQTTVGTIATVIASVVALVQVHDEERS